MTPPPYDRHQNLQMVPFGRTDINVCPVPSCGGAYQEVNRSEAKPVAMEKRPVQTRWRPQAVQLR